MDRADCNRPRLAVPAVIYVINDEAQAVDRSQGFFVDPTAGWADDER
jgi:hypothetical protein